LFSTAADNIIRVYKLDTSRGVAYVYTTEYDTSAFGVPSVMSSKSDSFLNVGAGLHILMFKIVNDQLQLIESFQASTSNSITCLYESSSLMFVGLSDGSINTLKVIYSNSDNSSAS
jgi:hypothetical protein